MAVILTAILLLVLFSLQIHAFRVVYYSLKEKSLRSRQTSAFPDHDCSIRSLRLNARDGNKKGDDVISRRNKRRGKASTAAPAPVSSNAAESMSTGGSKDDGSSSLEDLFGLGGDQLRELMEQELPVPRENVATGKAEKESDADKNKVFKLPDLNDFVDSSSSSSGSSTTQSSSSSRGSGASGTASSSTKIDRSNQEEYLRVLQLNPFADADDSNFKEEYDIFPSIFGSGKLLSIPIPYLQQGHGMLLVISLLAALVYAPGNPLTEFPAEIRSFLKQGLVNVYAINTVLAGRAFFIARSKNLPGIFWAVKTFILGGLPFYEISQARDPTKPVEETLPDPSDRKSKRFTRDR